MVRIEIHCMGKNLNYKRSSLGNGITTKYAHSTNKDRFHVYHLLNYMFSKQHVKPLSFSCSFGCPADQGVGRLR